LPDTLRKRAAHLEQDLGLEFPTLLERLHAGEFLGTDQDVKGRFWATLQRRAKK
jgi:hypothetical protein